MSHQLTFADSEFSTKRRQTGSSSMACGAVHRQTPEAGARCVNRARRDLCGGYPVTGIPTATA